SGSRPANVPGLSTGARADAGEENADARSRATGIRFSVVRRADGPRPRNTDGHGAVPGRPRRRGAWHRRDASDGTAGRILADAPALLRERDGRICSHCPGAECGWDLWGIWILRLPSSIGVWY